MLELGYEIAKGSLVIGSDKDKQKWHFSAVALLKNPNYSIPAVSRQLSKFKGVESFQLSFARN